jgi:hypothetical protein
MKKLLIIFTMLLLQVGIFAQDNDVPVNVTKAFNTKFPAVEAVEWTIGDAYIAVFWIGDFYKEAIFTKAGEWQETSTVMEVETLSSDVLDVLIKELGEVYLTYLMKIESKDSAAIYVIDLSTDTENLQVTTDMSGKILKKIVLGNSTDNDDGF